MRVNTRNRNSVNSTPSVKSENGWSRWVLSTRVLNFCVRGTPRRGSLNTKTDGHVHTHKQALHALLFQLYENGTINGDTFCHPLLSEKCVRQRGTTCQPSDKLHGSDKSCRNYPIRPLPPPPTKKKKKKKKEKRTGHKQNDEIKQTNKQHFDRLTSKLRKHQQCSLFYSVL